MSVIGARYRNRHTGEETTVLSVGRVRRHEPHALAQAPDGRLLFGDYRPVERLRVFFEGGAPPGYDQAAEGGWELREFLEHWEKIT